MVTKYAQMCMDELKAQDFKYKLYDADEEHGTVLELLFGASAGEPFVRMLMVFDAANTALLLQNSCYITVPTERLEKVVALCDELNRTYRFSKFCVDPEDYALRMDMNSFVDEMDVVSVMHQCISMSHEVLIETYPMFMKAIWA